MDLKSKIGIRVKRLRTDRKKTQEVLAHELDRSHDSISEFERGRTGQALDLIEEICANLEYPVSDLFADIDESKLSKEKTSYLFELKAMLENENVADVKRILDIARIVLDK
jgi:transcriptional regulator with XRE-family HTH domain